MASTPRPVSSVAASMRRAHARRASTSRPESSSSRMAMAGLEHAELQRLVALLLAAGEVDVDGAVEEAVVEADALGLGDDPVGHVGGVAPAGRRRPPRARRPRPRPGTSVGYCMARNRPAWARSHGARPSRSTPSRVTEPAEHLVAGPAHDHVRQRRLARAVRAHDGVDLAGADGEVDPLEDLLAGHAGPQAADLEHVVGHATTTSICAVDDAGLVHGHRPWWPGATAGSPVYQREARCRASSTRARASVAERPRPRTARCPGGCSGRRWRRRRRRCARRRWRGRRPRPAGPCPRARSSSGPTRSMIAHASTAVSLAATAASRRGAQVAGTGSWSSTSSKNPATISRSATPVGHAAALEVEALLLVDRTDGRGVAAVHVVVLDLEVGHRLGPRVLGELDVAVGLEGVGAPGVLRRPG